MTDIDHVDLLDWSHQLDRRLLQLPFRSLHTTTSNAGAGAGAGAGTGAVFLYKLAHSSARNQLGFLLLDCDTCTAFYEGVSLRTLNRRTQIATSSNAMHLDSYDSHNLSRLTAIVDAIHHALDPNTALNSTLKTNVGLETTRFSSSLSISIKSTNDQDPLNFKTAFDLDPLDHASLSNMLSSHFVRPLLSLAAAFASSATSSFLDNMPPHNVATHDSLELVRRSALIQAGLPVELLCSRSKFNTDNPSHTPNPHSPCHNLECARPATSASHANMQPSSSLDREIKSASSGAALWLENLDDHSDLLFFGPPGHTLPQTKRSAAYIKPKSNKESRPSSPILKQSSDDGNTTLTARLTSAIARPAHHTAATPVDGNNHGQAHPTATNYHEHSDTSQEESLPVLGSSIPNLNRSSSVAAQSHFSKDVARHERAPQSDTSPESKDTKLLSSLRQKTPALTPPPPSFDPTASQISPSRADAVRDEQQRRCQEIARIKRGANAAPASSTSSVATSASATTAAPSCKRSRF
ncbi:uncharacterized protein UTRI_04665_B [Ustilago trichophora]|uniref:Uncharacterized protein n=1 Tax=Ustilago trichophora TaxID=86804 RepID=A0A5C3EGF7_9BASI|nr:uncharacterized protein UTRI_04665_B [Ustilago trichophora]